MSISIYTTPSCGYCRMLKDYLKEKNIKYTEYNVANDQGKAEEMVRKSSQTGVPVIDFNGKIIIGFDRSKLDNLISHS